MLLYWLMRQVRRSIHWNCKCYIICCNIYLAPSAPINVTSHNISSTSINVTWQPPIKPNGIVRSYRIRYTTGKTCFRRSNNIRVNATNISSTIVNNLEKFTEYDIEVFATTISEGDRSITVSVTTDEDSKHCILFLISFNKNAGWYSWHN